MVSIISFLLSRATSHNFHVDPAMSATPTPTTPTETRARSSSISNSLKSTSTSTSISASTSQDHYNTLKKSRGQNQSHNYTLGYAAERDSRAYNIGITGTGNRKQIRDSAASLLSLDMAVRTLAQLGGNVSSSSSAGTSTNAGGSGGEIIGGFSYFIHYIYLYLV